MDEDKLKKLQELLNPSVDNPNMSVGTPALVDSSIPLPQTIPESPTISPESIMSVGTPAEFAPAPEPELLESLKASNLASKHQKDEYIPKDKASPPEAPLSRLDTLLKEYEDKKTQREGGRTTAGVVDALTTLSNIVNRNQPQGTGIQIEPTALKGLAAQEKEDYGRLLGERKLLSEEQKQNNMQEYYKNQLEKQGKRVVQIKDGMYIVDTTTGEKKYLGPAEEKSSSLTEYRNERLALAKEKKLDQDVEKISTRVQKEGLIDQQIQYATIDDFLKKQNIDLDDPKTYGADIPGQGVFGKYRPNMLLGDDAVNFRQAIDAYANTLLKVKAGTAVSKSEQLRLYNELGRGLMTGERSLLVALKRTREILKAVSKNALESYDPKAKQEWKDRTGQTFPHDDLEARDVKKKELMSKDPSMNKANLDKLSDDEIYKVWLEKQGKK